MPYLAMDLEAKKAVPSLARALGMSSAEAGWGLLELWEWCWAQKRDNVSPILLRGFFGADNPAEALEAFGFIERVNGDTFRVRGAERYLKISAQRSTAGKGRAALAKRTKTGTLEPSNPPVPAGPPLDSQPAASQRATSGQPALSPNTQHPTPLKDLAGKSRPPSEDLYVQLTDALFQRYRQERGSNPTPRGKDWKALKRLRERVKDNDAEILVRWGRGLRAQFKARVDCFWDLDERWDALATDEPNTQRPRLNGETTDEEFRQQVAGMKRTADGQLVLE